ncbi:MAG: BON domain-containing protein [Verrucomicrobiota bacterium]
MKIFFTLVVGIVIGALVVLLLRDQRLNSRSQRLADSITAGAESARAAITNQWGKIRTEDITNELARTGQVIRQKAQTAGRVIADATADARITTAIKAKLAADSGLASFSISVNTTEGVVTLAGSVRSPEDIRKAIAAAQEVDGVAKVVSSLQIKAE